MGINPENCAFCGQFEIEIGSRGTQEFFQVYPTFREKGQVINASDNFVLIPDIAPITEDYLLLVSKAHFSSFAAIPKTIEVESEQMMEVVVRRMKEFHQESEIIAFEHGVGTINGRTILCGGCGRTDHAHLHILPVPKMKLNNIAERLAKKVCDNFELKTKDIPALPNLDINSVTKGYPYLYLGSSIAEHGYVLVQESIDASIPPQLIRKLLAVEVFGIREEDRMRWDWTDLIFAYPKQEERMILNTLNRWMPKK